VASPCHDDTPDKINNLGSSGRPRSKRKLSACSENRALVFADGHLAGIVSSADISRALERLSRGPGTFASAKS
jgi:hypothetical protein